MDRIQFRRDTLANWNSVNPILLEGEIGYVSDDPNLYKMGDGVKTWDQLPFRGFDGTIVQKTGDNENAVMSQKATSEKLTELGSKVNKQISIVDDNSAPEVFRSYVADIIPSNWGNYSSYSIRVREINETYVVLYLYGWLNNSNTMIGRCDVPRTINSITRLNFTTIQNGYFYIDGAFTDEVIAIESQLVNKAAPYYSLNPQYSNLRTSASNMMMLAEESKNGQAAFEWSMNLIPYATINDNLKERINNNITNLCVYCKQNVSGIRIVRLYHTSGLRYVFAIQYEYNGTTFDCGYNETVQSAISQDDLSFGDDNVLVTLHIDWDAIGNIFDSGVHSYEESGISQSKIKPFNQIKAEKTLFGGGGIIIEGDSSMTDSLIVCGADASINAKIVAESMAQIGRGFVCKDGDTDVAVNAFIDRFINEKVLIKFFGTITTTQGIHKHPLHNLDGYNCTLKMGDNLGTSYEMCIKPTAGEFTFEQEQVVSHNYTYVKGFTLDGNSQNNTTSNSVYGAVICGEIYNQQVSPYSKTQLVSDIVLEDINAKNTLRGIIVGIGWRCKNLTIGDSTKDHALYLAGADRTTVENVHIYGSHYNGAVSISGQTWDVSRQVKNVILRNVFLDEVSSSNGALLDIRGHFSNWGNNKTLRDIFIDGFYIKKKDATWENKCINIGTYSSAEVSQDYTRADYPFNIVIKNFVADIQLRNTLFSIYNANVNIEGAHIRLLNYRDIRPLFNLQSNDLIKGALKLDNMRVSFDGTTYNTDYVLFGIDNVSDKHSVINGLDISGLVVDGSNKYYLFGRSDTTATNVVTIKNVNAERVIASPVATLNPNDSAYIKFGGEDYYKIVI